MKQNKQYDLLIDNGINFVKQTVIKGLKKREMENKIKQEESSSNSSSSESEEDQEKEERVKQLNKTPMQRLKESLPIFKYRTELLALIRDNQTIIMVG